LINLVGLLCLVVGVFVTMGTFSSGFVMRTTHPELSACETVSRCWGAGKAHGNMWTAGLVVFLWFLAVFVISFLLGLVMGVFMGSFLFWIFFIIVTLFGLVAFGIFICLAVIFNVTSDPTHATVTSSGNSHFNQRPMVGNARF
ncbi:hypothetical protein ADUPG1_009906, partial [Aduncisulcus paluster]